MLTAAGPYSGGARSIGVSTLWCMWGLGLVFGTCRHAGGQRYLLPCLIWKQCIEKDRKRYLLKSPHSIFLQHKTVENNDRRLCLSASSSYSDKRIHVSRTQFKFCFRFVCAHYWSCLVSIHDVSSHRLFQLGTFTDWTNIMFSVVFLLIFLFCYVFIFNLDLECM